MKNAPGSRSRRRQKGFSMLEIVVIIVVAGFLGMLLVQLMGTQLTKSGSPLVSAKESTAAETAMENIVAFYTTTVSSNVSTALNVVTAQYTGNSTVSLSRSTFNSVDTLSVTVTVGQSSLTTLFTQERTNAADNAVTY